MSYDTLEMNGVISPELYRAIEIELEISDLLFDGFSCNSPEVQRCIFDQSEVSEALEQDRTAFLIARAVGKELWRQRVYSIDNYRAHREYAPTIYNEAVDSLWLLANCCIEENLDVACEILEEVNLPPPAAPFSSTKTVSLAA